MAQLEKLYHNTPADFVMMLGFGARRDRARAAAALLTRAPSRSLQGAFMLLAVTAAMGSSPKVLGHNLSCMLLYIWARAAEGQDVNVMDLFTIKAELLPWFFAAQVGRRRHVARSLLRVPFGHTLSGPRRPTSSSRSSPRTTCSAFSTATSTSWRGSAACCARRACSCAGSSRSRA